MNDSSTSHLITPAILPPLDPDFRPAVLTNRAFQESVSASGNSVPVHLALERSPSSVSRFSTAVFSAEHPKASQNFFFIERLLKFLLWSRGGARICFAGPRELGEQLQRYYRDTPTGRFDAAIMEKRSTSGRSKS